MPIDRPGPAQWLAGAAGHTALIGAAVLAVQFSLDGAGLEALVVMWSEPDSSTEVFEAIGEFAPEALIGTALTWVMLLYGLAPMLAGSSLILSARPALGWSGLALGAFSLVGAFSLALRIGRFADWLVFAGSTIGVNLWIVIFGLHLFRQSRGRRLDRPLRLTSEG